MKKKTIFLDIDGVLNNDRFSLVEWKAKNPGKRYTPYHCFNSENVEQFNRLVRETGAEVVVSSTWRIGPWFEDPPMTPKKLEKIIRENGGVECNVVDFTPEIPSKKMFELMPRWREIEKYLHKHNMTDSTFVVLDDRPDAWRGPDPRFIQTDEKVGLTAEDVDRAIGILNGTS